MLFGSGIRLFDRVDPDRIDPDRIDPDRIVLDQVRSDASSRVTHLTCSVGRRAVHA